MANIYHCFDFLSLTIFSLFLLFQLRLCASLRSTRFCLLFYLDENERRSTLFLFTLYAFRERQLNAHFFFTFANWNSKLDLKRCIVVAHVKLCYRRTITLKKNIICCQPNKRNWKLTAIKQIALLFSQFRISHFESTNHNNSRLCVW